MDKFTSTEKEIYDIFIKHSPFFELSAGTIWKLLPGNKRRIVEVWNVFDVRPDQSAFRKCFVAGSQRDTWKLLPSTKIK